MIDVFLVVSYGGLYGYCFVEWNFFDDLMQMIVVFGGVIGMGYWVDVICDVLIFVNVVKMIVNVVVIVGEDYVLLGFDFDGFVEIGFDISELVVLMLVLLDVGLIEL